MVPFLALSTETRKHKVRQNVAPLMGSGFGRPEHGGAHLNLIDLSFAAEAGSLADRARSGTLDRMSSSAPRFSSLLVATGLLVGTAPADACTTFLMDGGEGPIVGKSYDWSTREGLVLFNKAGLEKSSLVFDPGAPLE